MFRMKFVSRDTAGADEESSVGEKNGGERQLWRESTADAVSCSPQYAPPVIYEGRVGKFGRIQRISKYSNDVARPVAYDDSIMLKTFTVSPTVANTGSDNCADVDQTTLVRPAQESVVDENVIVAHRHCQDVEMDSVRSQAPVLLEAPTGSDMRSTSSGAARSECWSTSMVEGEPTSVLKENHAVQGMIKKLIQKSRNNQPSAHDGRFAKSWDEPLLAAHDEAKLNLMAKNKSEIEAERLAEEEQQNCDRLHRELRDLANCVNTDPAGGSTRKSKLKKISRFLKNRIPAFRSKKIQHGGFPIARETKGVIPHARLFSGCRTVPSGPTDSALAMMRTAPQLSITKPNMQFAKVQSTQRDVPAWTREEYLRKNGRIPERPNNTNDEELGGALGLHYYNQNLDNADMVGGDSSDHDSDSD